MEDKKEKEPKERTFIMIKPDGVQRGLVGQIIGRFEAKGFKLVAMKMVKPPIEQFEKHYAEHKAKPFFASLMEFITSGPVVPMVWEGNNIVVTSRKMMGETKPLNSLPGTIRGDFAIETTKNIIHGSDSVETAKREIDLWFRKEELVQWEMTNEKWIY